jgi:hypothetical protein
VAGPLSVKRTSPFENMTPAQKRELADQFNRALSDIGSNPSADRVVVCLALGGMYALAMMPHLKLGALARGVGDPEIKKRAEEIVYRELERLVDGEEVDEVMRGLLGIWLQRRRKGRKEGRPEKDVLENMAVAMAVWTAKSNEPDRKVESIYAEVAHLFGISRRSVYKIMSGALPKSKGANQSRAQSESGQRPIRSWEELSGLRPMIYYGPPAADGETAEPNPQPLCKKLP